ncbi:MAG: hypothetical protein Kow0062_19580 [Acidobacteriota bacterium]
MIGRDDKAARGVVLGGLDGSNPLAYLAALGTLRILDLANDDPFEPPKMHWTLSGATWHPVVAVAAGGDVLDNRAEFVEHLAAALERHGDDRPFRWAKDTNVDPGTFRSFAEKAAAEASAADRRIPDFAAAFASESLTDRQGRVQDTALRTMSGAGHQHFVGFMRQLVGVTERSHLAAALFDTWAYGDEPPSMRWDPADDRRYALRWSNPSGDQIQTVRGANRLAVEALPLMATAPRVSRLETTGFDRTTWRWPIWVHSIDVRVVRSLLTHPALHPGRHTLPDLPALRELGVAEVFQSKRITVGKYRNFTPAVPVSASPEHRTTGTARYRPAAERARDR